MIKLENTQVLGWEAAIRGMRNPMNSWEKSDSRWTVNYPDDVIRVDTDGEEFYDLVIGPNDQKLMMNLARAGSVDAKYRRMIVVTVDITAPLYWWKEFDTYKVGTVANSCSTMHKIHDKEFTIEDFSHEHLIEDAWTTEDICFTAHDSSGELLDFTGLDFLEDCIISALNDYRKAYLATKNKKYWWQMIQLLPSSYNQRRTVMLNYEVLAGIYPKRKDHKLDEWHEFCDWIKSLPYSEIITLEKTTGGVKCKPNSILATK